MHAFIWIDVPYLSEYRYVFVNANRIFLSVWCFCIAVCVYEASHTNLALMKHTRCNPYEDAPCDVYAI